MKDNKAAYEAVRGKQKSFTQEVDTVLRRIIKASKIDVVNIESRTKSVDGFCEKAGRDDKDYADPLREITDLSGCRVICYYTSDIEKISNLIEENFDVDQANSIDRLGSDSPQEFGYQSKHIIVSFNADRLRLPDFQEFRKMKAEIQVRTSLQHSWASIEHKLQYKNADHIAPPLRRKLFRIAALLELADEEFNYLEKNIKGVRKDIEERIEGGDLTQTINADSVDIYTISSGVIHEVRDWFKEGGFTVAPAPPSARKPISKLIDTLIVCDIGSVAELDEHLQRVRPRELWREAIKGIHDEWRSISPHPKPVVDTFTIVRMMVLLVANEKLFSKALREVPFGPTLQSSLSKARKLSRPSLMQK